MCADGLAPNFDFFSLPLFYLNKPKIKFARRLHCSLVPSTLKVLNFYLFHARMAQRLLRLPAEEIFTGSSPVPRFRRESLGFVRFKNSIADERGFTSDAESRSALFPKI